MASLSVIIITKNEAHNIRACLESVKWADEIIVVDSGSTDDTVAICREFTPHVYLHDWPGFGQQKNRALGYASKNWVMSLDADERVTPELNAEIQASMNNGQVEGYEIPRLSSFCGRYMRHSGWYPDYVTRLFLRNSGTISDDLVHERVIINGKLGRLKHALLHESFRDLDQLLAKMNHYSTAGAEMLGKSGRDATLGQAISHGLWAFIRTYFIRAGFLDGREGFMLAVSTAEATYYRYAKRLLGQQQGNSRVINIVEPTLMTEAGHCHSFVSALIAAGAGDRPIRLWINRKAAVAINTGRVEIHKYFYRSIRRFQSYFLYRRLLKTEGKLFISTAGRTDLLLLHWAAQGLISPDKVYLYFHWYNSSESKIRDLKKIAALQPNLVILGPTSSVVTAFKSAGFTNASIVPYPITPRKIAETSQPKAFSHLLYAGAARQDKGFGKVVDLVEYLYQTQSLIPVIIQTSSEHFGKCDAKTLADIKRLQAIPYKYLRLKTAVLSAGEYADLFAGAIVLQLYNITDFSDRISGVTLDALTGGCPVITIAGTWISGMVDKYDAGLIVDTVFPENVLGRVDELISNYKQYSLKALEAGQLLQRENNASKLYKVIVG